MRGLPDTHHRDGSVSIRIPKGKIELVWNILREGRVRLVGMINEHGTGAQPSCGEVSDAALDIMSTLDCGHGNNAYGLQMARNHQPERNPT